MLESTLDRQQQFRQRDGFFNKVIGAQAGRLDRGFNSPVPGHHDNRAGQATIFRPFAQQRNAVHILHPDVEQNKVRAPRTPGLARRFTVLGRSHGITLVLEDIPHQGTNVRLVINNQNMPTRHVFCPISNE